MQETRHETLRISRNNKRVHSKDAQNKVAHTQEQNKAHDTFNQTHAPDARRTVMSARAMRQRMSGGSAAASNLPASARAMRRGHRRVGAEANGANVEWEEWGDAAGGAAEAEAEDEGMAHSTRTQSAAPDTKSSGSCSARASWSILKKGMA